MNTNVAIALLRLAEEKGHEFVDEAVALLERAEFSSSATVGGDDVPATGVTERGGWTAGVNDGSVLDAPPPEVGWHEIDRMPGETYRWPDGNLDEYELFVRYRATAAFAGDMFALGYLATGDVVGFVLGTGGGSKRGITYFFPADDFDRTKEKLSMIRGGGKFGRSGFGPEEPTPRAYATFDVQVLRERKAGKWNVQAVVVDADDVDGMLLHTALQAMLRGLTSSR